MKYLYNAICTPDGTIIESLHRHDFVCHKDKNGLTYCVDGGNDYLRRNYHEKAPYKELSIEDDGKFETRREYLKWGNNYDKDMNRLPKTIWKPIKELTTGHIEAILNGNYTNNEIYLDTFKKELEWRKK
jgi:hypothetical protein